VLLTQELVAGRIVYSFRHLQGSKSFPLLAAIYETRDEFQKILRSLPKTLRDIDDGGVLHETHYNGSKDIFYISHALNPDHVGRQNAIEVFGARLSGVRMIILRMDSIRQGSFPFWAHFFHSCAQLRRIYIFYGNDDEIESENLHRGRSRNRDKLFIYYRCRHLISRAVPIPQYTRIMPSDLMYVNRLSERLYYLARKNGRRGQAEIVGIAPPRTIPPATHE
jgi:hypothetical protein